MNPVLHHSNCSFWPYLQGNKCVLHTLGCTLYTSHCMCIMPYRDCTFENAHCLLQAAFCKLLAVSWYSHPSLNSDVFEIEFKRHLQSIRHLSENARPLIWILLNANRKKTSPLINYKVNTFLLVFYHCSRNIPDNQSCLSEIRGAAIWTITDTRIQPSLANSDVFKTRLSCNW